MGRRYLLADGTITPDDVEDLIAWLRTDPWLTQGPLVREFEARWAEWLGTRYACFVNSGSSANLLMYDALLLSGRLRNKKVVVPAVSWPTSVAPAIQLGLEPIMCDAEEETFGLDPEQLEDLIKTHDPAAVLVVHVLGVPARMEALLELQDRYGFLLLEDACAATGSRYDDRIVGTFGCMSTFSLFYGHHLSTIEGGMVCTDDAALHDLVLQLRSHGWAKDLDAPAQERLAREHDVSVFNKPFTFYHAGFNLRSTDLNARIGLSQMKRIDRVIQRRVENHRTYQTLMDKGGLNSQRNERAVICPIAFAALARSTSHREQIAKALAEASIETRPIGGGNMSRQPYWKQGRAAQDLPVADRIAATAFQLPNHPGLDAQDIQHICQIVLSEKLPC